MTSAVASGPSTYKAFAKAFTTYHEQYAEAGPSSRQLDSPLPYDVVLDEQGGLLNALMGALEDRLRSNSSSGAYEANEDELTGEERGALLLEHRTWQLIRAVYDNRLHRSDPSFHPTSAAQQLLKNPYVSPQELATTMVNEDPDLSLYATLIEHLQSRPLLSSAPPLEARHGYLPSTLRRTKASRLQGGPLVPPSLDPDFTLREPHGTGLAGEDQTYQTPLLETLFDLVRHGELDQAIKVCEQGGEPWRAATLVGGRRWTMGGMTKHGDLGPLEGNRSRALWKKACKAIATNPTLSSAERHLYAALVSDLPTLLPACSTWEDYLWAHIQARLEGQLEKRWHELGSFWEKSGGFRGGDEYPSMAEGLDEIFESLQHNQKEDILSATSSPYYLAQRMIILGRTEGLLKHFADRIEGLEDSVPSELIGPLIRFFAHLILLLRSLAQAVPESASNAIIQAYLQILEREGDDRLVAMYAACLREGNAEESYARYLRAMDQHASREAREDALGRARQHNLNVAAIATETVRIILSEAFETIPALSTDQPDTSSFAAGLSERDVYLIRSLEWLTMMPGTLDEALVKSNDVCRYFLALGQANAAQALLKTLPASIGQRRDEELDDDDLDHQISEHEHFLYLFRVFANHEVVEDVLGRAPKATAMKMEQHNWRNSLHDAIQRTRDATVDLLTSDWLRFRLPADESALQRQNELSRIRQIFVPDLVLRLHNLLCNHHIMFPPLLQQALDLTKVVADEDNHVYEEFIHREGQPYRLVAYLDRVREASLAALESGSGSAFVASAGR